MMDLVKQRSEFIIAFAVMLLYGLGQAFHFSIILSTVFIGIGLLLTVLALLLYKDVLLLVLSFSIPLTVPLSLGGGARINFPSETICLVMFLYFAIRTLSNYKFDQKFIFNVITLLLLVDVWWLLVTSFTSSFPLVSFKRVFVRLMYVIVYFFMFFELYKLNKFNILKVFLLYCVGLIIPIIYTSVQHSYFYFSSKGAATAGLPFYNDHTLYGAVLAFFIPFLVYRSFVFKASILNKCMYILLLVIFLIALFLSYSRAAWVSVIIAAFIYILLRMRIKRFVFFISILVFAVSGFFMKDVIVNYFVEVKETSHKNDVGQHFISMANVNTDVSNAERLNRWKCAYRMFLDKPVLGFGPGTYQFNYGIYQQRKDLTVISTFYGDKGHAHSEYLNYLCEAGLIGFCIFMGLIIAISCVAIKIIYQTTDPFIKSTTMFLFLGLCTFFIHSIFNGFIETDKMAMPVFVSMAAIVYLHLLNKTTSI